MTESGWGKYTETVLVFRTDPQIYADLRVAVPNDVRDALRLLGTNGRFAVITAYNPNGRNLSGEENTRRQVLLEVELMSSGEGFVHVDACSPDRSHCERSIALPVTLDRAIEIAKKYEQLAVFWFDGTAFWIEPVLSDLERIQLPAR
jgi:hypothetical protein